MIREVIYKEDFLLEEHKRIVLKLIKNKEYSGNIEFAIQYLYFKDNKWIQIVRIDNQFHKNKPGTHIHIINKRTKNIDLTFQEAKQKIIKVGEKEIKWLKLK